jgi:hypothetical protein
MDLYHRVVTEWKHGNTIAMGFFAQLIAWFPSIAVVNQLLTSIAIIIGIALSILKHRAESRERRQRQERLRRRIERLGFDPFNPDGLKAPIP